jgi:hypothetical protein
MTTDYHHFTSKSTPKSERKRLNVGDIWNNSIQCKACGEVIRSTNRHDFRTCKCGAVAVDGGSWYLRRAFTGASAAEAYVELAENFDDAE